LQEQQVGRDQHGGGQPEHVAPFLHGALRSKTIARVFSHTKFRQYGSTTFIVDGVGPAVFSVPKKKINAIKTTPGGGRGAFARHRRRP